MIVCVCNQVSDRQIKCCVRAGMSFNDIQLEFGVATCCGTCETCATELVEREQALYRAQREPEPSSAARRPALALTEASRRPASAALAWT